MLQSLLNFTYLKDAQLDEFYAFLGLHAVGLSLSSVFIPVYLWDLGYALWEICAFFALVSAYYITLSCCGLSLLRGRGHRALLIASVPVMSAALFALSFLSTLPFLFFIIPLGLALNLLLFGTAYYINLAHVATEGAMGKESGMQYVVIGVAQSIAPFLGGVIAVVFGFQMLFFASIFFLLLSLVPVWRLPSKPLSSTMCIRTILRRVVSPRWRTFMFLQAGFGAGYAVQLVVWPLFLFITISNLETFGAVLSLAAMIALFVQYIDGVGLDTSSRKLITKISVVGYSLVGLGQVALAVFPTTALAGVIHALHHSTQGATFVSYTRETVHETKTAENPGEFSIGNMFVWHSMRLVLFVVLAALAFFLPFITFFITAFLLGAVITWSYLLLNRF